MKSHNVWRSTDGKTICCRELIQSLYLRTWYTRITRCSILLVFKLQSGVLEYSKFESRGQSFRYSLRIVRFFCIQNCVRVIRSNCQVLDCFTRSSSTPKVQSRYSKYSSTHSYRDPMPNAYPRQISCEKNDTRVSFPLKFLNSLHCFAYVYFVKTIPIPNVNSVCRGKTNIAKWFVQILRRSIFAKNSKFMKKNLDG